MIARLQTHEFADATPQERQAMADVLTTLLCDLHRRGIYHRDMKADNITWRPGEPARLLDYETVRFPRRVSFQQRMKNLSQVNSALPLRIHATGARIRRGGLAYPDRRRPDPPAAPARA